MDEWIVTTTDRRERVRFDGHHVFDDPAITGMVEVHRVATDLDAIRIDIRTHEHVRITVRDDRPAEWVNGSIRLAGELRQELPELETVAIDNTCSLIYRPSSRCVDYALIGGQRMVMLAYYVAPGRLRRGLDSEPPAPLGDLLGTGGAKGASRRFLLPYDSRLLQLAQDILNTGYASPLRTLFLESRLLEFIVRQCHLLTGTTRALDDPSAGRVARVQHATRMLDGALADAPTVPALAASVGLTQRQLERGFHQLYGTSVIGYLRERRLQLAYDLLARGNEPIEHVARQVGYVNASNFANAFRKRFRTAPGHVRRYS